MSKKMTVSDGKVQVNQVGVQLTQNKGSGLREDWPVYCLLFIINNKYPSEKSLQKIHNLIIFVAMDPAG